MMAFKLGEHEESCDRKPAGCHYCDEKVAPSDLLEHMNICGAKTYKCAECGEYVRRADKRDHDDAFCEVIKMSKQEME